MRCAVVLLALAAFGAAIPQQPRQHAADQDLLTKQQDCIQLLQQISQQQIPNEQLQILGTTYDIEANYQQYQNPILVKYYVGAVQAGLIQPRGTPYSNSISQLRKEVSLLHRIFLGANNYQTFLKTAAWARINVNEDQFVKAFIGAVLQRQDTQGVILPPLYEIIPNYYFDARIIQEAQDVATKQAFGKNVGQHVVIPVNYTSHLPHGEHQLAYFTQDPGLANYYGFMNLAGHLQQGQQQTPVQQQGIGQTQQGQNGHGSRYYYLHQQLLAHYGLNRLSNGLGPIQNTDFVHVNAPYYPHLRYLNGLEFPSRSQNLQLNHIKSQLTNFVKILEQRVVEAIDTGLVFTPQGAFLSLYQPQGLNILGELIEGTGRSVNPRYYGSFQAAARQLLGNAPEVQNIYDYTPSVLELGQIAVQDPAFYQLYKKVIKLFVRYQNSLPAYQYNDVLLPGVTIQNVQVSPLVTLFNDYFVDLNGATVQQNAGQKGQVQQSEQNIKAQLKRLDHKPYEYLITVQSKNNVPGAVVRVFMGPKYDYQGKPISISQHRHQFVEFDQFITDLQQGQNVITRNSQQAPGQSFDYPSVQEIQKCVNGAIRSQEPFYITEPQQIYGFPARLALPKGQQNGLELQLLVVISQPGYNVQYGPVIPEQYQTYHHNEYQVVGAEEYQQIQNQGGKTTGIKMTVEVAPEDLAAGQQQDQAVRNQFANLYTQQHGQYPYTHGKFQVGQGQNSYQNHYGNQGQYQGQYQGQQGVQHSVQGGQGYQGQQGGQGYQGQQGGQGYQGQQGSQGYQGQQGGQGYHSQGYQEQQGHQYNTQYRMPFFMMSQKPQELYHSQKDKIVSGVQGMYRGVQDGLQGVQGMQGVHAIRQGVQSVQSGVQSGLEDVLRGVQTHQGKFPTTYQGQSQQAQGLGVGYYGSGQYHAGGYQSILGQGQKMQDTTVSEYFQNKHISEIIGGAISLDGKPYGYPLDRPLTQGALFAPNVYVQAVKVYHEGQPTNELYYQY